MELKTLNPGDKVELRTSERTWTGLVLESYDSEIILLKLDSGYNIGIREREVLDVKVLQKFVEKEKKKVEVLKNKKLPNVAMIITGGTISSRLDPKTGGVISTDEEEILNIAPELKEICNISRIEKPFMKFSENMAPRDWKKLAEVIEPILNEEDIKGIIITHGTDTLHYTSAALSFFIGKPNKPIALTYSQRSIDRGSTDASLNLVCAAKFAVSDIAEICLVGHKNLDDEICIAMPGTKVRKMHSSRRDTFKVINSEPFAEISKKEFPTGDDLGRGLKILRGFNARSDRKVKADIKFESKVAVVKVFPGSDPHVLDFYANKGYKGIILEMTGLGQVPTSDGEHNWLPTIKKNIEKGITICGVAQTIYGTLNPNVYSSARELEKTGIIFLKDMLSETALVKLGWVLGHSSWVKEKKIKEKMLENISGEFNDRLEFGF